MEEESELLKERLQAITHKRKLQEGIAQRRLTIEEEKIKLHHLKKKSLREKWLLDGLSTMSPEEQQETLRQNQEDQQQVKNLEHSIVRLEQEIQHLEKEEVQLSNKEVQVLQRLKSVERTTEDIIKAVKAEAREEQIRDIYADIPDLPASYKPQFFKRLEKTQEELGEEPRKALFAMEIKVEKDMKTGKSTVLSSIPVPSSEVKDAGVKVYDDGRKSVFAVSTQGGASKNGVDSLAPVEVEDILRKATEKTSQSPTEYHEPVFSFAFNNSRAQKGQISQTTNGHVSYKENQENGSSRIGKLTSADTSNPNVSAEMTLDEEAASERPRFSQTPSNVFTQNRQIVQEHPGQQVNTKDEFRGPVIPNPENYTLLNSSDLEGDVHYKVVHAQPSSIEESEPVTMIFMGYKHADEAESKALTNYEGVIRAELVVISDDDLPESSSKTDSFPHVTSQTQVCNPVVPSYSIQKIPSNEVTGNNHITYKNSISLQEQEATLGENNYPLPARPIIDDGTEDPSLTALRIRMAKLGKKVI